MISTAVISLAASTVGFIFFVSLIQAEKRRKKRFLFAGVRGWLDGVVGAAGRWVVGTTNHFVKYVVQLSWYYSLHSLLQTILRMIVATYEHVERVFEKNRVRTKELRAEKMSNKAPDNHLSEMAAHKEETALTKVQQNRRKKKHLEGK